MKTKIKNIKYLIIGIIIGLSLISAATYAYTTQAGKIGSLFVKITSTSGDDTAGEYRLDGKNIKDNTVDNGEIDNTDEYFMKTLELTGNSSTKGLKMHNGNITGVNQLEINDPGEGVVFKGNTDGDISIKVKDDSHDNMLGITGPSSLKVGIGTSSPGAPLHIDSTADVQGGSSNNGALVVGQTTGKHVSIDNNEIMAKDGNNTSPLSIQLQGNYTKFGGNIGIRVTPSTNVDLAIGDNDTGLKQQGDGELAIYTNNNERVRVDNNGNVGIGTSNPEEDLHIKGDARVILEQPANYNGNNEKISKFEINVGEAITGQGGDFFINDIDGTEKTRFLINKDGNVGIGTKDPIEKLEVNGNIIAQKIKTTCIGNCF